MSRRRRKRCSQDGCDRWAKYSNGMCNVCWRRLVWGPRHVESERAKARARKSAQTEKARVARRARPTYFTPPTE